MNERGFCQMKSGKHEPGQFGYFPLGLVRGQFGAMRMDYWLQFLKENGFDGYEHASWELELGRCADNDGAKAYAEMLYQDAQAFGLKIFSLAVHLQGQALGDEPSAKTLQFVGGQAVEMYKQWRQAGNEPPRHDPYYVPPEVGVQIHKQAEQDLRAAIRLAYCLGELQGRHVVVSGFVGSPANCWSHFFGFPPLPKEIGGYEIPDVRQVSLNLLVERFTPVFDTLRAYAVKFGLECHPSERAMGDIASARDFLKAVDEARFDDCVGFNLDASHLVWQGVDPIAFIREFAERIWSVHIKGVQVAKYPTRNGLLGGHQDMGDPYNGWNFVTAGSDRDSVPEDELLTELRRVGYRGAVSIEWEDNDAHQLQGAMLARERIGDMNVFPSGMRHDEALKAKE